MGKYKTEHEKRLKSVFKAKRKANSKLYKEKCQLGVRELAFVGDILSSRGIRPDTRKVSATENMQEECTEI